MTRYVVQAGWKHAPHISEQDREDYRKKFPPNELKAREEGNPALGAGAIYPVPKEDIVCKPFKIPDHWPRAFGMDVGWNRTAAIWGGLDRDNDVLYLYSEHYRGQAEPSVHSEAIKRRGAWIPGAIDPASRTSSQVDGKQLLDVYTRLMGLTLHLAENSRESGIHAVFERLSTGRLRVFETCQHWFEEYALYHRDETGKIVKQFDHLMDATRYLVMTGIEIATTKPRAFYRAQNNNDWRTM